MHMQKIIPCLWFNGDAEEAVNFYVSLLPDSKVGRILHSPAETHSGPAGSVLTVDFTLAGSEYVALNGGPQFSFTEAVSFQIPCDNQAEIDRLWNTILGNGGSEVQCGWIKDRWGLSWQIFPKRLTELLFDPNPGRAKRAMEAMMQMIKIDLEKIEQAAEGR